MADGQTATNPQTGQRVVLQGGQWVPLASQAAPAQTPRAQPQARGSLSDPVSQITGAAGNARISSAFRDPERNRRARGATNSYHTRGQALDLVPQDGETMGQLYARMGASGIPFRELLNEGDHVHVAWDGEQLTPDMTVDYFNQRQGQSQAQPQQAQASAPQRATNPQTGETVELIGNEWVPVGPAQYADPSSGAITVEEIDPEREARKLDPEYQRAFAAAQGGSENVPDALRAFGQGQTLGFLEEINAAAQGGIQGADNLIRQATGRDIEYSMEAAAQAARDSERDAQARYAQENPVANFGLQLAGGLLTPGLSAGGNYIAGAEGAARLGRAGAVGAGYGAAAGFGNAEGDLIDRAPEAGLGAAVGFGTGAVGQRVADRLAPSLTSRAPSAARRLSREGVDLTPGQMAAEIPVVGPMLRSIEEGASSIPFVGSPIAGARQQSVETFNRAAINRALAPINSRLPKGLNAGYEAVENAQRQLGRAYDDVLPQVSAIPDQQYYDDLAQVAVRAAEEMPDNLVQQYGKVLQGRLFRGLDEATSEIDGSRFKSIESELGALSREQRNSLDPANRALGRVLDDTREVVRDLIARQNPAQAERIRNINRGYANLTRVEQAAGSTASQAAEGVFTPTQLGVAAARGGTRSSNANESALMQDLAVAGRSIIPSRVGDSGTATRGAITGLVAGAASGVPVAGAVAAPVIATSIAYSRPAQAALNALYRATDSQTASANLQQLARLVQRNPALQPYYQDAVEHVLSLGQTQSPASPPAPQSQPVPTQALQRVMQP